MNNVSVWGFRSVPPFAQGLVRDLRVRWALQEAGLAYEVRHVNFEERTKDCVDRRRVAERLCDIRFQNGNIGAFL